MTSRTRHTRSLAGAIATIAAATTLSLAAQTALPSPQTSEKLVAAAALEPLLPTPVGWTRTRSGGERVTVSEACSYTFADGVYTRGESRVRITLADTGRNAEGLTLIATLVVSFPDDYVNTVPPATTIARLPFDGAQAASRWDADQREGEFVVLVGGRFVAKAEGTRLDALATLRGMVELVDLKKLGALK